MTHRRTRGRVNGRHLVGFALGVIGLVAIAASLANLPTHPGHLHSQPINRRVVSVRHVLPLGVARRCACPRPGHGPRTHAGRVYGDGQGDARVDLQQAAVASRRSWLWSPGGETRTILWINAPASIASTSPRAAMPRYPLPSAHRLR